MICKICKLNSEKMITVRSGEKVNIYLCKKCNFFFSHNPKKKLFSNKLNISRLKQAGLKIPTLNEDFKNGTFQSKIYMKKYLKKN